MKLYHIHYKIAGQADDFEEIIAEHVKDLIDIWVSEYGELEDIDKIICKGDKP